MEVLPEDGVTQEAGSKVRQDHQYCVEEHLDPELDLWPDIDSVFVYENGLPVLKTAVNYYRLSTSD